MAYDVARADQSWWELHLCVHRIFNVVCFGIVFNNAIGKLTATINFASGLMYALVEKEKVSRGYQCKTGL